MSSELQPRPLTWIGLVFVHSAALGAGEGLLRSVTSPVSGPSTCLTLCFIASVAYGVIGLGVASAIVVATRGRASTSIGSLSLALAAWIALQVLAQVAEQGLPLVLGILTALLTGVLGLFLLRRLGRAVPTRVPVAISLLLLTTSFLTAALRSLSEGPRSKQPSVLLVTIDTLRADRLGCYGWKPARSETIDALAESGIRFTDAHAPSALTCPSHVSILTGMDPFEHGAISNVGTPISPSVESLADYLSSTHETAAFVSGLPLRDEVCGLASRFDHYDQNFGPLYQLPEPAREIAAVASLLRIAPESVRRQERRERRCDRTIDRAIDWIDARKGPWFAWIHLYDPHIPYAPPEKYIDSTESPVTGEWYSLSRVQQRELIADPSKVARMLELYDGEVAFVDDQLERLLSAVDSESDLLIAVTSDHGETHGEHDSWFSRNLHKESLHVPLILRLPNAELAGSTVDQQVRLIDLTPTLLDYLEIPFDEGSGASLIPSTEDPQRTLSLPAYALALYPPGSGREESAFALRKRGLKLIWRSDRLRNERREVTSEFVYDVTIDPDELADLATDPPQTIEELRRELDEWTHQHAPDARELTQETREGLESLGYTDRD